LLPFPAKALADNNNELPSNTVKSFVAFMNNSLLVSPGASDLETALRPAEDFVLLIRLIRWFLQLSVSRVDAAKFALDAENNFMIESG
jgi:hypothetical protein